MASLVPAKRGFSRVFITEDGSSPENEPEFQTCVAAGGVEQSFGDATNIECPDPTAYGEYQVLGTIRGAAERPTVTLSGRYASNIRSTLFRLAVQRKTVDVHIHFGSTTNPSLFNEFTKGVVIRNAVLTDYSTDELGALSQDDESEINEELDVSGTEMFEVVQLNWTERATSAITNEIVGAVLSSTKKGYVVTLAAGGSASTPADVLYTEDAGSNWTAVDVDTLNTSNDPTGIAIVGSDVVVISNAADAHYYAAESDMVDGETTISWTEVTGYNAAGSPNAIGSVGAKAYVVGDGGYVYSLSSSSSTPTVLDAGVATSEDLNAVSVVDADTAVAVGANGAVVYTTDGTTWAAITGTVPGGNALNAVAAFDEDKWLVGDDAGNLYYTLNGGATWTAKSFSGSGAGSVTALSAPNETVVYMAHQTSGTAGRVLRSYDGGYSWNVMPETTGSLPANDKISALATISDDVNLVIAGGLADDGSDGILLTGKPTS